MLKNSYSKKSTQWYTLSLLSSPQYTIVPARRSTAEAVQILISHLFGDAISPTIVGGVSHSGANVHYNSVTFILACTNSFVQDHHRGILITSMTCVWPFTWLYMYIYDRVSLKFYFFMNTFLIVSRYLMATLVTSSQRRGRTMARLSVLSLDCLLPHLCVCWGEEPSWCPLSQ